MRKSFVFVLLTFLAYPLYSQEKNVTPTDIHSPGPVEYEPFNPSATYTEMLGNPTIGVHCLCSIADRDNPWAAVYRDTVEGMAFAPNEHKVITFDLADLDPGRYYIMFWAESPYGDTISNPPAVDSFEYIGETIGGDDSDEFGLEISTLSPASHDLSFLIKLSYSTELSVSLYDLTGRRVTDVIRGTYDAGHHYLSWDASDLPRGAYLVRFISSHFILTSKIVLIDQE